MSFEEFETKARLYVVGVLEESELAEFSEARKTFGERAEEFIRECRRLSAAFALSLRPRPTAPATREKLLAMVRDAKSARFAKSRERDSRAPAD